MGILSNWSGWLSSLVDKDLKSLMRRKLFPLFVAVLGFLLLVTSASLVFLQKNLADPTALPLPNQLAGVSLTNSTFGASALSEFSRMHNENISLQSGAMGVYGQDNQATIWAAQADSISTAEQLLVSMQSKIAQENSPFQPLGQQQVNGVMVEKLTGMNQTHFYFQSGKKIIWIAANENIASQALQEVIDFYR